MLRFLRGKKKHRRKSSPEVFEGQEEPEETEVSVSPDWPVPVRPSETLVNGVTYPRKINESVFELYAPEGRQELDIVFFHGLQIGVYDAYIETWQSGTVCWPQVWLPLDFPGARILSIAYDSSARRSKVAGHVDLPKLGEVLVDDVILSAGVGAKCPVVLVGHSLGGIVIKQMCLEADRMRKSGGGSTKAIKAFLKHVRGMFYYSVPHGGSHLANLVQNYVPNPGAMIDYLTVLSTHTEEINDAFQELRQKRRWRADGVSETRVTGIGLFRAIVVKEDSARQDVDNFTLLQDDHISICKPYDTEDPSYSLLKEFILELVP